MFFKASFLFICCSIDIKSCVFIAFSMRTVNQITSVFIISINSLCSSPLSFCSFRILHCFSNISNSSNIYLFICRLSIKSFHEFLIFLLSCEQNNLHCLSLISFFLFVSFLFTKSLAFLMNYVICA